MATLESDAFKNGVSDAAIVVMRTPMEKFDSGDLLRGYRIYPNHAEVNIFPESIAFIREFLGFGPDSGYLMVNAGLRERGRKDAWMVVSVLPRRGVHDGNVLNFNTEDVMSGYVRAYTPREALAGVREIGRVGEIDLALSKSLSSQGLSNQELILSFCRWIKDICLLRQSDDRVYHRELQVNQA